MQEHPPARIRDAASLILLQKTVAGPRILMGKRASRQAFMPNKWVFPGGAIDPADYRVPVANRLPPAVKAAVAETARLGRQNGDSLARALALAAIRETFEETGLILGEILGEENSSGVAHVPASWQSFLAEGYLPALDGLQYIARAITPPQRVRRFDARFFLADASHLAGVIPENSSELSGNGWFTFAEIETLELANITRQVIAVVRQHVEGAPPAEPPFWHWPRGHHR